ncbi:MAG TPA: tetratricopeptide repeat protein [Nitrospinaceae bacterium]|nr:tetratricopeptide repeat protein [Nitrospina sp.]HIO24167.1 tetratricopeptide repeat protein [Nitrospinaceae bacterium]
MGYFFKENDADAHHNLGNVYYDLKQYQDAIASFKEVIRIRPDDSYAYVGIGRSYTKLGQYQEAIAFLKRKRKNIKPGRI